MVGLWLGWSAEFVSVGSVAGVFALSAYVFFFCFLSVCSSDRSLPKGFSSVLRACSYALVKSAQSDALSLALISMSVAISIS